jgi:hypothetical protein
MQGMIVVAYAGIFVRSAQRSHDVVEYARTMLWLADKYASSREFF